ncbi:hypothetical protein SLE2022_228880 [Rubroshorea leprosula]
MVHFFCTSFVGLQLLGLRSIGPSWASSYTLKSMKNYKGRNVDAVDPHSIQFAHDLTSLRNGHSSQAKYDLEIHKSDNAPKFTAQGKSRRELHVVVQ